MINMYRYREFDNVFNIFKNRCVPAYKEFLGLPISRKHISDLLNKRLLTALGRDAICITEVTSNSISVPS